MAQEHICCKRPLFKRCQTFVFRSRSGSKIIATSSRNRAPATMGTVWIRRCLISLQCEAPTATPSQWCSIRSRRWPSTTPIFSPSQPRCITQTQLPPPALRWMDATGALQSTTSNLPLALITPAQCTQITSRAASTTIMASRPKSLNHQPVVPRPPLIITNNRSRQLCHRIYHGTNHLRNPAFNIARLKQSTNSKIPSSWLCPFIVFFCRFYSRYWEVHSDNQHEFLIRLEKTGHTTKHTIAIIWSRFYF